MLALEQYEFTFALEKRCVPCAHAYAIAGRPLPDWTELNGEAEPGRVVIAPPAGKDEVRKLGRYRTALVSGWAKDADANTAFSQTVEPLPFHGMSAYPYRADEHFPEDADHAAYQKKYLTRPALTLIPPSAGVPATGETPVRRRGPQRELFTRRSGGCFKSCRPDYSSNRAVLRKKLTAFSFIRT